MRTDWSRSFDRQLDRLEDESKKSDAGAQRYRLLVFMLKQLEDLGEPPSEDSAIIKRVRQKGRYEVWRISHPYVEGVALRIICWFSPQKDTIVVVLFAGDKARMGDVFYDTVASRADQAIEQWLMEEGTDHD